MPTKNQVYLVSVEGVTIELKSHSPEYNKEAETFIEAMCLLLKGTDVNDAWEFTSGLMHEVCDKLEAKANRGEIV